MTRIPFWILLFFSQVGFAQFFVRAPYEQPDLHYPALIQMVDVDSDDDMDFVAMCRTGDSLMWYEMLADSIFDPHFITTDGREMLTFDAVDMDADGDIDVTTFSKTDEEFYVFQQQEGNFVRKKITIQGGGSRNSVEYMIMYDFDLDDDLDIAYTNVFGGTTLNWLENTGNFVFRRAHYQSVGVAFTRVKGMKLYDINMDNIQDLLVITDAGDLLRYSILPDSTIASAWLANEPYIREPISIADMNGDQLPDIVTDKGFNISYDVVQFTNLGNEQFSAAQFLIENIMSIHYFEVADYNADGKEDIILTNASANTMIYERNGLEYTPTIDFGPFKNARKAHFVDWNKDNLLDVIYLTHYKNLIALYLQTPDQQFTYWPVTNMETKIQTFTVLQHETEALPKILLSKYPIYPAFDLLDVIKNVRFYNKGFFPDLVPIGRLMAPADIDNDGWMDVVCTDYEEIFYLHVLGPDEIEIVKIPESVSSIESIQTGDLDGDDDIDIVTGASSLYAAGNDQNNVSIFWNDGNQQFTREYLFEDQIGIDVRVVDIDHDNDLDIFAHYNQFYLNDGSGNFTLKQVTAISGNLSEFADFDLDGDMDLINITTGQNPYLKLYENLGNTTFAPHFLSNGILLPGIPSNLLLEDFDGDGDPDVVFAGKNLSWLENAGQLHFVRHFVGLYDIGYAYPAQVTDIDVDGDLDFIRREGTIFSLYLNSLNNPQVLVLPYYDENGNGIKEMDEPVFPDIVLIPPDVGEISIHRGSDGVRLFLPFGEYTTGIDTTYREHWKLKGEQFVTSHLDPIHTRDTIYFAMTPDTLYSEVMGDISSQPTRCGRKVPFQVDMVNTGSTFLDGYILMKVDSAITKYQFYEYPDTIINSKQFGWRIKDWAPGALFHQTVLIDIPRIGEGILPGDTLDFTADILLKDPTIIIPETIYKYKRIVRCSWDPNDKLVSPDRNDHYALFSDNLYYTIRFQNTGNDVAYDVTIRDTLSDNLDVSTLQLIGSSHPEIVLARIEDENVLVFTFSNIFLPDSTTSFQESQGYVTFSIRAMPGQLEQILIENRAGIYFDFNPAVMTNTTNTLLVSEFPPKPIIYDTLQIQVCFGDIYQGVPVFGDIIVMDTVPLPLYDSVTVAYVEVVYDSGPTQVLHDACVGILDTLTGITFSDEGQMLVFRPLVNQFGCDSLLEIQVTVHPVETDTITTYINYGLLYHNVVITADTIFELTDSTFQLCSFSYEQVFVLPDLIRDFDQSLALHIAPNPFNEEVLLTLDLLEKNKLDIVVCNALGQGVKRLAEHEEFERGHHEIRIPGTEIQPGIYFLQINSDRGIAVRKLVKASKGQ